MHHHVLRSRTPEHVHGACLGVIFMYYAGPALLVYRQHRCNATICAGDAPMKAVIAWKLLDGHCAWHEASTSRALCIIRGMTLLDVATGTVVLSILFYDTVIQLDHRGDGWGPAGDHKKEEQSPYGNAITLTMHVSEVFTAALQLS